MGDGPDRSDPVIPDDLPRSRSGRIPQWVIDEAAAGRGGAEPGSWRGSEPDPLGAGPTTLEHPQRPARRAGRRWRAALGTALGTVLVVAMLAVLNVPGLWGRLGMPAPHPDGRPRPGLEEASTPLARPPDAPDSTSFRFRHTTDSGAPITFSPCRPIHFVIRPDNSPAWGRAAILQALSSVSAATGLRFVDDGSTDEAPTDSREAYQPERYGDRWAPVLIAWAAPEEVPDLSDTALGEAGPLSATGPDGVALVSGRVHLDPGRLTVLQVLDGLDSVRGVLRHELAHVVGLDHVNDRSQLMYRHASPDVTDFAPGDLAGLARLGSGPCQPNL